MNKRIYKAAIYVRLSKEDGDVADARKAESDSISNQKSLILNFLKDKEDIEVVSIREDDGYTGTNFNRPAFQMMLQDVQNGIVDCIVVKDLSRFAREYIDAGRYIERLFPAMGVRFIAINDGIDTISENQSNEIIIPFKNLINDAYARDISIKIRTSLEAKRRNGEYVANYCVYGYKKDPNNRNNIIPDEYAGNIVQDIFSWLLQGMSLDMISNKLNALGILSPMEYRRSNGERFTTSFKKNSVSVWTPTAVKRIATNPIYIGTLIQGKVSSPNHKIKTVFPKDPKKWAVVENNHEALIKKRDFDTVQRLLKIDTRTAPGNDKIYLMSGIAVCADCGALMTRKTSKVGGKIYAYYMCSNYKKHKRCSSHRIREDKLESMIFETLKEMSALLVDADEALKAIGERGNYQIDKRKLEERIQKNNDDIAHWNQLKVSTYEDYRDGIIDKDDFILLKDSFEEKKKNALIAIAQLEEEAKKAERNKENNRLWIEEYRKVKSLPSLTRDILVNLVSEVKIFENKDIEIVLDDNDEYQYLIKMASEVISDPEKKDELERMVG